MADDPNAAPTPSPAPAPAEPSVKEVADAVTINQKPTEPNPQVDPNAPVEPSTERPEGLPEGDWNTWEEYGQAKIAEDEANAPTPISDESKATAQEALKDLPEGSREKAQPFFEEVAETGELSADSKKAAAEAFGVSEDMVDMYIRGAQASQDDVTAPIFEAAGGEADYNAFSEWAQNGGMTQEEMTEFNAALDDPTKGPETVKSAVTAWREAGNGPAPKDVTKENPTVPKVPEVQGYQSTAEMTKDMNDPRYQNDPAFRASVEAKVNASDVLG